MSHDPTGYKQHVRMPPSATMSGTGGWSSELAGRRLDHRRDGTEVVDLDDVDAAKAWITEVLGL